MEMPKSSLMLSDEIVTQLDNLNAQCNGCDINQLRDELEEIRKRVDASVRHLEESLTDESLIINLLRRMADKRLAFIKKLLPSYNDELKGICRRIPELMEAEKRVQVAEQVGEVLKKIPAKLKSYRQEVLKPQLKVFRELAEQSEQDFEASALQLERGGSQQIQNGSLLIKETKVAFKSLLNKIEVFSAEDVEVDEILDKIHCADSSLTSLSP